MAPARTDAAARLLWLEDQLAAAGITVYDDGSVLIRPSGRGGVWQDPGVREDGTRLADDGREDLVHGLSTRKPWRCRLGLHKIPGRVGRCERRGCDFVQQTWSDGRIWERHTEPPPPPSAPIRGMESIAVPRPPAPGPPEPPRPPLHRPVDAPDISRPRRHA